ncbi:uncharacterized protein LOC117316235 [Pecten maximus]|uniref:uncharacterized protein LOC117316235 n=1 Tax=Pecten maximus TaxID=6579 RepID=UPI001458B3D1|nr:uncharacterized protein LOC117316235 [Pecten maximus]
MASKQKSDGQNQRNGHTQRESATDDEDDFIMEPCGIGPCKPSTFQHLANIPCFVGCYSIIGLLSQSLNTYLGSQIPSIEKQFGLSSAYSGILMSFNDIGYLSVVLIVSTLAPYVHIPRVLFAAFLLYGISGVVCSLPHFVSLGSGTLPSLTADDVTKNNLSSSSHASSMRSQVYPLCDSVAGNMSMVADEACGNNMKKESEADDTSNDVRTMFLAIFGIGMILQGVAKSLRGPFVTVYVDDNGDKRKTGFYMGIIIAVAIAGPSVAFVVGGVFSRIYVTLEDVDITPRDPRWIGAWWIGFLLFGGASVIFAMPIVFFPRHIKKPKAIMVKGRSTKDMKIIGKVKERLTSFKRCFSNTVWICLLLSGTIHLGSIGGYISFLSKYIKIQFNIPLWQANMILASTKAAVGLGTFLGGLLTRMMKLTPRRTIGLMITIYIVYVIVFLSSLFLGCDQPEFVGPERFHPGQNLTAADCSAGCDCKDDAFFPVCGSNGVNYHSPCFAGCPSVPFKGQHFTNCTCIPDGKGTPGECQSDCAMIYPFAVLCVFGGFLNALLISPGFIAKLRCVEDRDKATALGCMSFLGSILGWMPTPIIIGKVIDTTCIIWQDTCNSSGACLYYILSALRLKVHAVILGYKILSLAFLFLALYLVRNLDEWPQNVVKKFSSEKDIKTPEEMKTLASADEEVDDEKNISMNTENKKPVGGALVLNSDNARKSFMEEEDDYADARKCGLGSCRPAYLQKFANIQSFIGFYSIQKYVHIPLILFGAFILYGVSGILCSVPHFISVASNSIQFMTSNPVALDNGSMPIMSVSKNIPLCVPLLNGSNITSDACVGGNADQASGIELVNDGIRQMFLAFFGIGMMLQGVGKSLRGPFLTVYIDDNGKRKRTGFYMGVIVALAISGPVFGYIFGGMLSRVYVTLEDVDMSPRDPRWIGAWWLGFLVFGAASIVFSIPLVFFPKHLKKQAEPVIDGKKREEMSRKEKIKESALSYWRIAKNPVYMAQMISSTLDMAGRAGYYAFLSKYINTQFNIPLWQANITLAIANISSIVLGSFFGGFITRRIKLTPCKTLGLLITLYAANMILFAGVLLLGCSQPELVGPKSEHAVILTSANHSTICSYNCGCKEDDFFPICGSNGINYHSPCYAGCAFPLGKGGNFANCTCIPNGRASAGLCESDCGMLYPFAIVSFVAGFIVALTISPSIIAKIRCVEDRDKSTSIGLSSFFSSLLGFLPSPIIFGKVVDSTCLIWQKSCGTEGACLFYDNDDFRLKIHLIPLVYMFAGLCCLSFGFYKVRLWKKWPSEETEEYQIVLLSDEKVIDKTSRKTETTPSRNNSNK